jgi:DNA-directed RNA polymerase
MIKINKENREKNIYIRVPNLDKKIDSRMTLQALTPNTIHAYDASVMFLCIKICKEIGIEILVIHDCIGCKLIHAVIVKKIFKIANIEILRRKNKEKPFPIYDFEIKEEELKELKIKILESTNFFR